MGEALFGILTVLASSFAPAVVVQLVLNFRPWITAVAVAVLTSAGWILARFPVETMEPMFVAQMFVLMALIALPFSLAGAWLVYGIRSRLRHGNAGTRPGSQTSSEV